MSNIYNHRQIVPGGAGGTSRVNELLEALKQEFDTLQQEAAMYKMQRDDLEHKVQQQTDEVNLIRQGLYDLQNTQKNIKAQYDSDIRALQREMEQQRLHSHPSSSSHSQPPSHPQPPPPTIGQGQSNIFGAIMSGGGGGQQVLVAPPQMSIDPSQQPPPGGQGHPGAYPGPGGPPQSVSQSGGSSAPSPYLNGGGPPPPLSQQHANKRQRMEESGPPSGPQGPMGLPPNSQQAPSGLYGSNGIPPGPTSQQSLNQGGYITNVGQSSKPVNKMPKMPQNLGPEGPQSSGVPPNGNAPPSGPQSNKRKNNPNMGPLPPGNRPPTKQGSLSGAQPGLGDMDPETVPAQLKREGGDWFAIFNPKVPRVLDVELIHTLDHSSVVCCVKFSADGKYLATGCNRIAQIYDVSSGQKICVLDDTNVDKSGDLYIRSVCFSPDGKYLATGAEDKQIRIWDIHTQTIRKFFTGHEQDIYSLDFSRDGRFIVSGSGDKTARVWDMVSGELLYKLPIDEPSQKDAGVTSVAISPDALYVAAGSLDKIVRVWDARTGFLLERLEGHKDSVYSVAFAPDGKTLVSGSLDKTLKLWDMSHPGRNNNGSGQKNQSKTTFTGHKDFVLSVAVSPDGRWVVSGSKDRGVQFWDPQTAQTQFMLQGHKNSVISVALSQTGKLFATGSGDCRARVWRYHDDV
ncbi:14791_t:CDS:10 [Funneliformis mosseae]|uniref:14791_t:CDS:1 n=1 Tax=Funneliformis mosseae TaxID=27381 RepID=A0A9N8WJX4_FUNMO|nr:14791_t:CDS:10 [Funneliformis mosseae]